MRSPRSPARVLFGRFTVSLVVATVLVVAGLVGVNIAIDKKIDSIKRVKGLHTHADTNPGQPANFLLIGSDTRAFAETPEEQQAYGDTQSASGQRSDTIMVVHVEPAQKKGFLVSFPRDLEVDIPGMGHQKINAAYNSGPQKVIDTLDQDFHIPIHHYLEVDFESFKGIVDAVGGVPIYFPAPARDQKSGLDMAPFGFRPGCYVLDGSNALGYARSRDYEEQIDGKWQLTGQDAPDIHRIQRQQTFLRRLASEAVKKSLGDPLSANKIADRSITKLKADPSLGRTDIDKLITAFRHVNPNDPNSIQMITFPYAVDRAGNLSPDPGADGLVLAQLTNFGPPASAPQGPSPSQIRVRIFNGSGTSGAAAQAGSALEKQKFVNAGVGNNPGGRIAETEVRYRKGSDDKARVVQSYLGGVGKLVEDNSIVEADVTVVLGRDFKGVSAPASAGTATSAAPQAPATTAAAPSSTAKPGKGGPPAPPPDPTQC